MPASNGNTTNFSLARQGLIKYRVDAQRNVLEVLNEQSSAPGGSITLTIDVELQRVLEDSLAAGLQLARDDYDSDCVPDQKEDPLCPVRAVGVVLDATNGEILAMASIPTYDPNLFVGGVSQTELDAFPRGSSTTSRCVVNMRRLRRSRRSPT